MRGRNRDTNCGRFRSLSVSTCDHRRTGCGNGLSYIKADCEVEIVGNKWDNPELLEVLGDEIK